MRRLLVLLFAAASLCAQELPQPTGPVSDFADVLTKDEVRALEQELKQLERAEMIIYRAVAARRCGAGGAHCRFRQHVGDRT